MVSVNLKKLVLRQEWALIQGVINATDSNVSIETADGQWLMGSQTETEQRYPITLDGQILGWVNGDPKAEVIATLISQLAYRESEKRALAKELLDKYKEISLLFNLSEKIIDSSDVREVGSLVLEEARQLLKSSHGALWLMQAPNHELERIASFGGEDCFQKPISLGDGIIGNIVQAGRGEIVNDVCLDWRDPSKQQTALMGVPLKSKESTIGAIALSRSATRPYSAEELKLLTTMAFQVAGVINALLHERQLKESRQNALIFRLSSQIRESLEPNIILTTAVGEIYRTINVDRCCFLWVHTESKENNRNQETGPVPSSVSGLEIVIESRRSHLNSLTGHYALDAIGSLTTLFGQQTLIQINDVNDLEDKPTQAFLQTHNFSAFLAIPMQTRSGRIGAICCGTSEGSRIWSDGEVNLLQAVTNQLAIALDQAELYEQSRYAALLAQDKAQQLEATLHQLQHTQLQLVQSEKMSGIGQMIAGVAHEINNPVTFIYGNLEFVQEYVEDLFGLLKLYREEYTSPSTALQTAIKKVDLPFLLQDLPDTLNSMAVGTERIRDIVLSLKNFARSDQAEFKTVNIHEGIDSTLLILRHRLKAYDNFPGIEVIKNYGDLPSIHCYPSQLNQVFMNLLANAIDVLEVPPFSHGPEITIETQQIAPNRIQIRITDNGPGIVSKIQNKLFDPFFTTKEVGKGTGLGLSISYQIITERHNGSLICQSEGRQGSTFVIEIPIQQENSKVHHSSENADQARK
ncbi:GAF domain-containing sensor histidine kinase [Leptothoe sp. PORK10 BA2]|uniref:GAF domain-containing sensor histidine kinase n=1 Tax=Leptothoe sp. PORK10 BA2 TaxID=3110254 RepID=UPI002B215535|nr:GAF domain-containing protein [Leptothoe sp. PORK10 BA2]MEA5466673.1 GAF domain-containing protein [Leptothoe sp. PORK10 BA2]